MDQENYLYEEKIETSPVIFLVPIITAAIASPLIYYFLKEYKAPDQIALKFYLLFGVAFVINLVQIWFASRYEVKLTQTQLVVKTFLAKRLEIKDIKELEIRDTKEARIELGMLYLKKNSDPSFIRPANKNKITEKVIAFNHSDYDNRVLVCTNNPDQLLNLLVQYGAQKK